MKARLTVGLLFGLLLAASNLFADEIRPALLEINERDGGCYRR